MTIAALIAALQANIASYEAMIAAGAPDAAALARVVAGYKAKIAALQAAA